MWETISLPRENADPLRRERWVGQFARETMGRYDGTVFLSVAPSDQARCATFQQAAQSIGCNAQDGRSLCAESPPQALSKRPGRHVLFVHPSMQQYLGEYLDACPDGARHVLLYSRRRGNGPTPYRSAFLDFWMERGVDIWDIKEQ